MMRSIQSAVGAVKRMLFIAIILSSAARTAKAAPAPPKVDDAIDRGLMFLARQQHAGGAFDATPTALPPTAPATTSPAAPAVPASPKVSSTALALLAFLSAGQTPAAGKFAVVVRNAADFLAAKVPADGYVGALDGSRMYGQANVTLALAQVCGVEATPQRRQKNYDALRRAASFLIAAQEIKKPAASQGGWGVTPDATESDLLASCSAGLALRAARDAGIEVPAGAIPRCIEFISRCYNRDQKGFSSQPGGAASAGASAVAAMTLLLLDPADRPDARDAARFAAQHPENLGQEAYGVLCFTTHACLLAGGDAADAAVKLLIERTLKMQSTDGGWPPQGANAQSRIDRSALALLTITAPDRLLPILQR